MVLSWVKVLIAPIASPPRTIIGLDPSGVVDILHERPVSVVDFPGGFPDSSGRLTSMSPICRP